MRKYNARGGKSPLKLWYDKPAGSWYEALPIGNGRLGGMVFGGTAKERIQLNEDTLWSGVPEEGSSSVAPDDLEKVRKLIFEGNYTGAREIIEDRMLGKWTESYQPLGDLMLDFGSECGFFDYYRELDIETSVATTTYKQNGVKFTREVFASAPAQMIVVRITSDKKGSISFSACLGSKLRHQIRSVDSSTLCLNGKCPVHVEPNYVEDARDPIIYDENGRGMKFEIRLKIKADGGYVSVGEDRINLIGADEAVLLLMAATSFNGYMNEAGTQGKDCSAVCDKIFNENGELAFDGLYDEHIKDYQNLFRKVELDLGPVQDDSLPFDERLEAFARGKRDNQLVTMLFQYGRYLMISSSRPGTQPANLQGIWNDDPRPPWSSNYTLNINTEMNYWPAEVCNLGECHLPLFDLIKDLAVIGANTAREQYGCKGWAANHNSDIWRKSAPVGGEARWAYWPVGGAWLCRHLWEHYSFGQDYEFLRKTAYPIIKEAAIFCLDWLVEDKDGFYVTCPSISPENAFINGEGEVCTVSMASTMDMTIIWELFSDCIEAGSILHMDIELMERLKTVREKLYPLKIGKAGQLQEWYRDFEESEPEHRHVSHLYGLYPGDRIQKDVNPEFFEAAAKSLERRISSGGAIAGWSCAWTVILFARLGNADAAYRYMNRFISDSTFKNLFNSDPKYQIDGNFGMTAAIAEMLLQSHTGEIWLLPALPAQFGDGHVKGLRARGGFEVDIAWKGGRFTEARIRSLSGNLCRIRSAESIILKVITKVAVTCSKEDRILEFETEAGMEYDVRRNGI